MKEFEHRLYFKSHQISFWCKNIASEHSEADSAIVHVGSWNMYFTLPDDESSMRNFGYMLEAAFAIGRDDAKAEIRKAIGL